MFTTSADTTHHAVQHVTAVMPTVRKRITAKQLREQIAYYGSESAVVNAAMEILAAQMTQRGAALNSPQAVRDYLRLNLSTLEYEAFWGVYLDAQNRVIGAEELFRGTLTQTSVFPREVVKRALQHNAAAMIFAHNHPSGVAEPSRADETLTQTLKHTLGLIDVKALDHFIIGQSVAMSFAERGLL